MRLVLHPKVYSDIDEIMRYYQSVATPELADEFYAEFRSFLIKAADTPAVFALFRGYSYLRLPFSGRLLKQ